MGPLRSGPNSLAPTLEWRTHLAREMHSFLLRGLGCRAILGTRRQGDAVMNNARELRRIYVKIQSEDELGYRKVSDFNITGFDETRVSSDRGFLIRFDHVTSSGCFQGSHTQ